MTRSPFPTLARVLVATAAIAIASPPGTAQEAADQDPKLEKYFNGNALYNRKAYVPAITQYQAFLKEQADHPKADLAKRGLALSYYALKQYEKAEPVLKELLGRGDLDPAVSRERLVMLRGQCLMLTGDKKGAKDLFVAEIDTLENDAYRAAALAAICDGSFGESDWEATVSWAEKLLAAKPSPEQAARARYQQGYAQYQLGRADDAIASLGAIAGLGADALWKTRADYLLGECHNQKQDYPKAEAAFAAALPGLEGKDAAECQYRLGITRFLLGKHKEAVADLDAFLAAAGDSASAPLATLFAARARIELADYEEAEPALRSLAGGNDDTAARANLWLARIHTRRDNDYAKAAEVLAPAASKFKATSVADELDFDLANALIARPEPDWKTANELLSGVEKRGEFGQMGDVLNQRAVCAHKLGAYDASLAANDAFLARHGDHPRAADARFMRAENLFLLGKFDDAAKAYTDFATKHADHPSYPAAGFRRAQILHDAGRWEDCLKVAKPMLDKQPQGELFAQLPFIVGDCLFRLEKWEDATAALDSFLEEADAAKTPNADTALMQRAIAHDRLGAKDKALADLADLASVPEVSPQLPLALAEQGRLAFEAGNNEMARKALERFLAEDAKKAEPFSAGAPAQRPRVHYYLGWLDAGDGEHAKAAEHFGKVSELDKNHPLAPDAALQQGVAWVNLEEFGKAAEHFPRVLSAYPKHPKIARVEYYAGLSLARGEQWDKARNHFKRVAEQFGESDFADRALYEWAWCERRSDRAKEAVTVYERLLAAHSDSPLAVKVQSELAELNMESGDIDKVIAKLADALKKADDPALKEDIRYQLASAQFKKGDHQNAAAGFESMAEDYPESELLASIRFQAGESRLQLGETVAARDHFAAASGANLDEGSALAESVAMRLAETQALTGEHAAAESGYRRFLEDFPDSRWTRNAQFGLAFAMENTGKPEAAIPEYRKLLADRTKVDLWTVRGRFQIGECLFNLQKYDDAITEFVHVEINYTKYPAWQAKSVLEMARVLIAQDDKAQAATRLKDVITKFPKEKAATVAQQYLDELRTSS